jgi:hypothetical protein
MALFLIHRKLEHNDADCQTSLLTGARAAQIEHGLEDYRRTGSIIDLPYLLSLKAEALHLAHRTAEALEAIQEADKLVERSEARFWCAELNRLRGLFLAALGAEDAEIENSLCAAISTAKQQKPISLEKRAEATYEEYRRQKASALEGHGFRLPLG